MAFVRSHAYPLTLFLVTCLTVTWAGSWHAVTFIHGTQGRLIPIFGGEAWRLGLWFTLGLLGPMVLHELGHLLAYRHYRIPHSQPYFMPAPFAVVGTVGAFIRLKGPYPTRTAMAVCGASGPLFGFLGTLLAAVVGMRWSVPYFGTEDVVRFGTPALLTWLSHAPWMYLHPLGAGAWLACLVTFINALPAEHFDGGVVLSALWPKFARLMSLCVLGFAFAMTPRSMTWAIVWAIQIVAWLTAGKQSVPEHLEPLNPVIILCAVAITVCVVCTWTTLL